MSNEINANKVTMTETEAEAVVRLQIVEEGEEGKPITYVVPVLAATVTIEGRRPLLQHCFDPEVAFEDKKLKAKQGKDNPNGWDPDEWKKTYKATETGQLCIPNTWVYTCLRDGGKFTKYGRGSLRDEMAGILDVVEETILIDRFLPKKDSKGEIVLTTDSTQPVYRDVRGVKNPATRGRNVRTRVAMSPGWRATFNITWEANIVSAQMMQMVIIDAGRRVGIGDSRAIGFGRFTLTEFKEHDA